MEDSSDIQKAREQIFIDKLRQFKEAQLDETGKVKQWLKLADKATEEPAA